MRYLFWLGFLFSAFLLQGQDSQDLMDRGHDHYNADRPDSAAHYYHLVLANDTPNIQLQAYTSLIKLALNVPDYAAADSIAELAKPLLTGPVEPGTVSKHRRMKASGWSQNGEYRRALNTLHQVANAQLEAGEESAAETTSDIAQTYQRMGLQDSSIVFIRRAITLFEEAYDSTDVRLGYFYNKAGAVYQNASRLDDAEHYFTRGIEIMRSNGETKSQQLGLFYNNLANTYADQNKYAASFDLLQQSMDISKSLGLMEDYGIALYNLGVNHFIAGNFGAAVQYVDQSIELRESLVGAGHPSLFNSYSARAILKGMSGDDAGAIKSYRRLIREARRSLDRDNSLIAGYFDQIGLAHRHLGQLDSAVYFHEKALNIFRRGSAEGTDGTTASLFNLSIALAEQERIEEATQRVEESLEMLERLGYKGTDVYGEHLGNYAMRLGELGRSVEAIKKINEALAIIRSGDEYRLGTTSSDALRLLTAAAFTVYENDPTPANLELFRQLERDFVTTSERTRRQFHDPFTKGLLNDESEQFYGSAYSKYFSLYESLGDADFFARLYELSEYGKATAIRDQLRVGVADYRGVPESIPAKMAAYQQEIEGLYYELEDAPEAISDSLDRLLFQTRLGYDSLALHVKNEYPEYYDLTEETDVLALAQVQSLVEKQGLDIVIYLKGWEGYYALIIGPDTQKAVFCGEPAATDSLIANWRMAISSVLTDDHLAAGHQVYQQLWEPLLPHLTGNRVMIVPAGDVHSVAFAALSASPAKEEYLVQDYTIHYAYSLTLYNQQTTTFLDDLKTGIVSVAPGFTPDVKMGADTSAGRFYQAASQPFAIDLAKSILKDYVGKSLLGMEATESKVRSAISTGNLLLFATHGYADEVVPLQSGIQLTEGDAGDEEDGFLSIAEIFNSNVPADLSILGICESGIGKMTPGEGMLSIAYAFSYAGCASTMNTLWPVDDRANAELLNAVVKNLADDQGRAEALRSAQLTYLDEASADLRHPYYWGALVVQGKDGPVEVRKHQWRMWFQLLYGVITVGFVLFLLWQRRRS